MTDPKRIALNNWFLVKEPKPPVLSVGCGGLLLLGGLCMGFSVGKAAVEQFVNENAVQLGAARAVDASMGAICGLTPVLIPLAVVLFALWNYRRDRSAFAARVSDSDADAIIADDLAGLSARSFARFGVGADVAKTTVMLTGPRLWNSSDTQAVRSRKGGDDVVRHTPVSVMVTHFCPQTLLVYTGTLDLLTGNVHGESTQELAYADVVSIGVQSRASASGPAEPLETVEIVTSKGAAASIVTRDPALLATAGGGRVRVEATESALQRMRDALRGAKVG